LWDLRSPSYSRSWDSKSAVNSVCLHPNQVQLVSGDQGGSLKVWDIGSNRIIKELIPEASTSPHSPRASIQAVDLSEDGRTLIAATNHAEVFVWDPSNPVKYEPLAKFRAHATGSYLLRARISPDCRSLVTTRYVRCFLIKVTTAVMGMFQHLHCYRHKVRIERLEYGIFLDI
jgi:G protein beta subunit-like protein